MKKLCYLFPTLFILVAVSLSAQSNQPSAILQYFDDPTQITIKDSSGNSVDPYYGLQLAVGDSVQTQSSTAEIQLDPNGSIIKLAYNTSFTVQTLQGLNNQTVNGFQLAAGTVRTIAAKNPQGAASYSIQTPTAVCGIRGTDFTLDVVPGKTDAVGVLSGAVNFVDTATGQSVNVGAGQIADTFASVFQAVQMSQDQVNQLFDKMNFQKLNPTSVPGHADEAQASQPTSVSTPPAAPSNQNTQTASAPNKPGPLDPLMNYLRDNLGMEIGTITVDGITYSQAVLQPEINFGKLHMALYLPVIYQNDLFNPSDWYHPAGNDEWSFGTDAKFGDDTLARVEDFTNDLFLKIRYFEYGGQRDPFYIKLGNLHDMTIGHGLLMNDFANDQDFPAVREVGLNMGLDLGSFGFESVVDNLGDPQIFGGRVYVRPFGKGWLHPAIGTSLIMDWSPAADFTDPTSVGDPIFGAVGADLDLPIFETDPIAIVAFADVGGMVPYFRNSFTTSGGTKVSQGPDFAILTYKAADGTQEFRNYGLESGLFGNVFILNWRLSYRNFYGIFQPDFFNSTYLRTRTDTVNNLLTYLDNPDASQYQTSTSGIYGQAGMDIGKVASFEAGYLWPWSPSGEPAGNDYLHLRLTLNRGIIPNFGISGALSYDRTDFIPTLLAEKSAKNLQLFDANTTMSGEVDYPIAPTLDLAILITTAVEHDSDGNTVIDSKTGLPVVLPSFSIETRVHF